ncbi:MAG: Ribosomal large subunit pseudouridine synthase B [Candidatus Omnitrophica bacterium]|nr:Ribosomal large subunit pseudouridine synthase B [Candidatus Omnitrophota bacterium]
MSGPADASAPGSPEAASKGERLQVVLARFGVASRRGVVEMIEAGRVSVNGEVVREKGHRVLSATDEIRLDGQVLGVAKPARHRYFVLYKPKNVMTTLQDPHAEHTVADYFGDVPERLFPVGRLDRDTTGLLIVTNDGELAFRLTHPSYGIKKVYRVLVAGSVSDEKIKRLKKGVELEDGPTSPCEVILVGRRPDLSELTVILHEGRKRQIRRIFEQVGHRVLELERVSYGPLTLAGMRPGQRRELRASEVSSLRRVTGLGRTPKTE